MIVRKKLKLTDVQARARLMEIKWEIVAARRAGDDERAALLSAEKERVKKKVSNRCLECGVAIQPDGKRCMMHARRFSSYRNSLNLATNN